MTATECRFSLHQSLMKYLRSVIRYHKTSDRGITLLFYLSDIEVRGALGLLVPGQFTFDNFGRNLDWLMS
jgi:hypothetical protein